MQSSRHYQFGLAVLHDPVDGALADVRHLGVQHKKLVAGFLYGDVVFLRQYVHNTLLMRVWQLLLAPRGSLALDSVFFPEYLHHWRHRRLGQVHKIGHLANRSALVEEETAQRKRPLVLQCGQATSAGVVERLTIVMTWQKKIRVHFW